MRAICAAVCLLSVVAPTAPSAAEDFTRFKAYEGSSWTVTDKGEERCHADFAIGGDTVLSFMGPYYFDPGKPASGNLIHLASATQYTLPKGNKYGEFPVQLVAGADRFAVSGFATDLGGALVVNSGTLPTVIDLFAALPDKVTLSAIVEGKRIYAIELDGNRAAAKALEECTIFITAQKRPGTRSGPKLGPPSMLPPPVVSVPSEASSDVPILALPRPAPPNPPPPSSPR